MNYVPVRNPVKKTKGSYPGYVPSQKMRRMIGVESTLERDLAILLEVDPDVDAYTEQPITIEYRLDDKWHSYTPDFAVQRIGLIKFVEVKPEWKALRPDNVRKFAAIRAVLAKSGRPFIVLTEKDIRRQPRLRNAELLHRGARQGLPIEDLGAIFSELQSSTVPSVETLALRMGGPDAINSIYSEITAGRLVADMSKPLVPGSKLSLAQKLH